MVNESRPVPGLALSHASIAMPTSSPVSSRAVPPNVAQTVDVRVNEVIAVAGSVVGSRVALATPPLERTMLQSVARSRPPGVSVTSKSNVRRSPPGVAGPDPSAPSPVTRVRVGGGGGGGGGAVAQLTVNRTVITAPATTVAVWGFGPLTVQLDATPARRATWSPAGTPEKRTVALTPVGRNTVSSPTMV